MRDQSQNRGHSALLFGATGWLFADLLLALAMIFLLAESNGQYTPSPPPPPVCTPAPTNIPAFDPHDIELNVPIDYTGILNNDPKAVADAQSYVRSHIPNGATKRAGLVLLYGGASGYSISRAVHLASVFYSEVLQGMGNKGFVFYPVGKVVHKEYHDLSTPPSIMQVDIFVFTSASQATPVANSSCVTATP